MRRSRLLLCFAVALSGLIYAGWSDAWAWPPSKCDQGCLCNTVYGGETWTPKGINQTSPVCTDRCGCFVIWCSSVPHRASNFWSHGLVCP
jgi:hypothetical protein